jgi:hypothetical protein
VYKNSCLELCKPYTTNCTTVQLFCTKFSFLNMFRNLLDFSSVVFDGLDPGKSARSLYNFLIEPTTRCSSCSAHLQKQRTIFFERVLDFHVLEWCCPWDRPASVTGPNCLAINSSIYVEIDIEASLWYCKSADTRDHLGSGRIYLVYVKLRAIYVNDPDKFGYYGNDPDKVFITKMTSMVLRLLLTDCTLG